MIVRENETVAEAVARRSIAYYGNIEAAREAMKTYMRQAMYRKPRREDEGIAEALRVLDRKALETLKK